VATGLIFAAHVTDHIDGRLARLLRVTNKRGSILDGLADRAVYISLVLGFVATGELNPAVGWLVVFREVMLYGVRLMRNTEWYPITGVFRRLAVIHGISMLLWLFTYLAADAARLFLGVNYYSSIAFRIAQTGLLLVVLGVAYYYLWRNLQVVWAEGSGKDQTSNPYHSWRES